MTDSTERAILTLLQSQIETRDSQHKELKGIVTKTHTKVVALAHRMDLHEQNDHHVHTIVDGRLASLETGAEATGQHQLVTVQADKQQLTKAIDTWKDRGWRLFAALFLTAVVALVTHYLSTH